MFNNILFVCVGNICRSPVAEHWARTQLEKAGHTPSMHSAGLSAMVGSPIAPEMKLLLEQEKIESAAHVAKQVTEKHMMRADIIFVMEEWQKSELSKAYPMSHGKIFCLGQKEDIGDPYRQGRARFQEIFSLICDSWNNWQKKLW